MDPVRRCPACGNEVVPNENACSVCHAELRDNGEVQTPRKSTKKKGSIWKIILVTGILLLATIGAALAFEGEYRTKDPSKVVLSDAGWEIYTDLIPTPRHQFITVEVTVTNELDDVLNPLPEMFRVEVDNGRSYGIFPSVPMIWSDSIEPGASFTFTIGFSIFDDETPVNILFEGQGESTELSLE